jgi:hypothetical protein
MKKTLLILFLLFNSIIALAQQFQYDNVFYQVIPFTTTAQVASNQCLILGSLPGNITIHPTVTYNGTDYTVTTIVDGAYYQCGIQSITIPNTVTSIGNEAFKYCTVLNNVVIPNSVTSIGTSAFYGCTNLTSVVLSNSITTIPESCFIVCQNLTSITLPNSLTSIGLSAFLSCGFSSITLPNTLTSIGPGAFENCFNLQSVVIPNSVTSIGYRAFESCDVLTSVTLSNSLTTLEYRTFQECPVLSSIPIPSSITTIGDEVFKYCWGLQSMVIPNTVTSLGNSVFYNCKNLTSVSLPNSLTSIPFGTFEKCINLPTITIPSSITSIGQVAFQDCTSLTSIICDISTPLILPVNAPYTPFYNVNQFSCALCVPAGSVSAYQSAPIWQNFNPIVTCNVLTSNNFSIDNNIRIYPNPVRSELFIDIKNLTNTQLEVMDITGKLLFNQTLNFINTIDTSNFSNGMYLFKIISYEGSLTTKVIKN